MAARVVQSDPSQEPLQSVPQCGRGKRMLTPDTELRLPEPAQLYSLIMLTLLVHEPGANGCVWCDEVWPCPASRRAYRLREGF
jgi:hypothetical protein